MDNVPEVSGLLIVYFGSTTGDEAAIEASVHLDGKVYTIVSMDGRPDSAGTERLQNITTSTLLRIGLKYSKAFDRSGQTCIQSSLIFYIFFR